ncbi:Transposase, partial [Aphelenchoides avenae]
RTPPGKWVFGGVCREDNTQSFAVCVPDRTAATLLPIVRRWIKPGTRIVSDDRRAYKELASDPDYHWDDQVHEHGNAGDTMIHTPTIESMWKPLK